MQLVGTQGGCLRDVPCPLLNINKALNRSAAGLTVTGAITTSGPGPYLHATDLARAVQEPALALGLPGHGRRAGEPQQLQRAHEPRWAPNVPLCTSLENSTLSYAPPAAAEELRV